ncbi:MAG TPA: DUF1127 domain-containing protein [Roseiarcus sp.]|nr:DUF1127 domain-containing protein [Roseiarcus sp.]
MLDVSLASRRRPDLSALVWRALGWPARVMEARRTLALLGQMSDRELSDIGLLRADLADCTALSLDDDPSERLARARATRAWYGHSHRDLAA